LWFLNVSLLLCGLELKRFQVEADQHLQREDEDEEVDYGCTVDVFTTHYYLI